MVDIPQSVFDDYYSAVDDFINSNFPCPSTLIYPGKKTDCPNCIYDGIGKKSANIYQSGGPYPFDNGMICPYCNGDGYKLDTPTEVINLRVYWTKKDWVKSVGNIAIPDGSIMVIGFITDLPKFLKCTEIKISNETAGYIDYKYIRSAEPFPWGLRKKRYFVGFLTRA